METKPAAPKWDSLAGADAKKAESRKAYERSEKPASSFKTSSGKEVKIDPKDKQIDYLRGRLDQSKWETRQAREDSFYNSYASRPLIVYNDCYHPRWNYYLMSRPIDDIAMWIYCHQATMDAARISWYYSQNAELRGRVAALEARNAARDPAYIPAGVDPDMAYDRSYVDAAFNPRPRVETHYHYEDHRSGFATFCLWVFVYIPLTILLLWLVCWLATEIRW